jgi:hypothetical protein
MKNDQLLKKSGGMKRKFKFSEPFLKAEYIENAANFTINSKTIVINADDTEIIIGGRPLKPWNSSIYSSVTITKARKLICITLDTDFFSFDSYPHANMLMDTWSHVYEIFSLPHLKDTKLWRSEKERLNNIEFNLWYAAAGTNCGIHNEHNFKELHTQIFGIGRMQKFYKNDHNSVYQDIFMSPGYTHEPFYDAYSTYPWHQYWADTDCIWLATEFYSE